MRDEQKLEFQLRVDRIRAKAEEAAKARPRRRTDSIWRRLGYPAAFIGAFGLGIFMVFLSRYIQYVMAGVPSQSGAQDIGSLLIACLAVFLLSKALKIRQKEIAASCTLSMFLTIMMYHNLVWEYPETFERVYGPEWVSYVQDQTVPSSIIFFGNVIELG